MISRSFDYQKKIHFENKISCVAVIPGYEPMKFVSCALKFCIKRV